jgi:hypothetical protein
MRIPGEKRRPRTRPSRRPGVSLLAGFVPQLFLALALLFSQAARLSEVLLVQHAICEHGAFLHVDADESASVDTDGNREESRLVPGASASPFEHEHCDAASIVHRPDTLAPLLAPPALLPLDAPEEPPLARHVRPIAILFQAPKASPPRSA